ncbi:unnamed protein product [Gulo gulo]|uniref:Uncharacterized protein n=1 Tax=Gulo gulo TaxID=48420 RepID=A0A9X9Q720_GULGU|nr:unnamed protein product [Gulo gulo]
MSPPPMGWGWEAPQGLEVGVGTDECSHSPPGSWLWTLHQSCHPPCPQPFSCSPLQTLPLYPHSAIVPPLDLLHLSSPAGPNCSSPCPCSLPPFPHPSFGSLSFLTSASQPHVLSIPTLPDPWVSLRSPSLRQRQAGVGPGLGPSPTAAPLPSPPLFV